MPGVIPDLKFRPQLLVATATLLAASLRFFRLSSLAPEAWFDEVWFALRARELIQHPALTVFYRTPWGGGNALMVYLTAAAQLLGFTGISSSRIASAALGVIAVPLAYACFDEVLRGAFEPRTRRWIAALAAFVLSYLLYWVVVSRVGTEPSLAPAAALFCVWQLKRAKNNVGQIGNLPYVLIGIVAGLAQYNGPHARFVLPLLAFIALHVLVTSAPSRRSQLITGYWITAITALLVASPLIAFFLREPEWLFARARITAGGPLNDPKAFRDNLYLILISFNFVGSFDPLTNYPGLPMFDLVQSAGFFVGHGWALWNLRKSAAARELLTWEAIMILPSLLTSDAPNFQRMIGFAAPAAAMIAVGWIILARWATDQFRRVSRTPTLPHFGVWILRAFCGLCLGFGIFISPLYQSYTLFVRYPKLSILPVSYLNAPVRDARELIARAENGERVFVSRNLEDDDVIAFEFLLPGTAVERLDFRQCLPLADDRGTRTNYVVLTKRDKVSVPSLYEAYPESKITAAYYWQDSGTWIEVSPHTVAPPPPIPGRATFDPGLTFVGYEWSGDSVAAGQSLFITLWWKVDADITADYTSFVHVGTGLDGATVIAQRDGQPCQGLFPTSHWRTGDLIRDSFAITFPPDAPAGIYPLAVGWYTFPDFARLPLLRADDALPDDRAIIGAITVTQ
ncbi:MAG TPA: hypothetical protein VJL59_04675 [Anaerolineales bacterium]|nr:hypothetical protein [Anaerolineales bacterium]